jgi:large subunit ribosomal protein L21
MHYYNHDDGMRPYADISKEASSMYAVVTSGGKQYKVEEGETLQIEKIAGKVGSPVTFDQVLMISDGAEVNIGQPTLAGATVEGHIVEQGKSKKIIVFKYKRRKRYRRKQGHRQQFTAVKIDSIKAKGVKARKKAEPESEAKKPVAEKVKPAEKKVAAETKVAKAPKAAAKPKETKKPEAKAAPKKAAPKKATATKAAPKKAATTKKTATAKKTEDKAK